MNHRIPLHDQFFQFAPSFRFLVVPFLADQRGEGIEIREMRESILGERDVFDMRERSREVVRREGEEGREIVVCE